MVAPPAFTTPITPREAKPRPGIYSIRCWANDTLYVGSTLNVRRRLREHLGCLRRGTHENRRLQAAWDKHGEQAFHFFAISYVRPDRLLWAEQIFIDAARVTGECFNLKTTADKTCVGVVRSRETRAKISAASRAKWADPEYAERVRASLAQSAAAEKEQREAEREARRKEKERAREEVRRAKGPKRLDPEHQRRMVEAARKVSLGRTVSEETRRLISEAGKGREVSEETRARLRAAHQARLSSEEMSRRRQEGFERWLAEKHANDPDYQEKMRRASLTPKQRAAETSARISAALRGRKLSPEHRAAIAAGNKGVPRPRRRRAG